MQHRYTLEWLVNKYSGFFNNYGLSEGDLRRHYEEWKGQTGNHAVSAYLWYLFRVLLGENIKQVTSPADYHRNSYEIYAKMWEFSVLVEGQKDNGLVQLKEEARVHAEIVNSPYAVNIKIASGHCCPYCDELNEQLFTQDEVFTNHYLGSHRCTSERGCNCRYLIVPVTDADGRLVLIDKNDNG